jgi:hypothetical protein
VPRYKKTENADFHELAFLFLNGFDEFSACTFGCAFFRVGEDYCYENEMMGGGGGAQGVAVRFIEYV